MDWTKSSQVKSSILFSQTASHLHIKKHIQNNVCRDGKAEKHWQRQLQAEARIIWFVGSGVTYIREFMVVY